MHTAFLAVVHVKLEGILLVVRHEPRLQPGLYHDLANIRFVNRLRGEGVEGVVNMRLRIRRGRVVLADRRRDVVVVLGDLCVKMHFRSKKCSENG